jgi:hypothetical protein
VHIECVNTLKELIETESLKTALDLCEVTLADRAAARFLAACELMGIELKNCPAFLRSWVFREQAHLKRSLPMTMLLRARVATRNCWRNYARAGSAMSRGCETMKHEKALIPCGGSTTRWLAFARENSRYELEHPVASLLMQRERRNKMEIFAELVKSQFSPIPPNPQAAFRPSSSVFSISCEWSLSCTWGC